MILLVRQALVTTGAVTPNTGQQCVLKVIVYMCQLRKYLWGLKFEGLALGKHTTKLKSIDYCSYDTCVCSYMQRMSTACNCS